MSRFKPGDLVRVRDFDDLENTFGYRSPSDTTINVMPGFVAGMRVYCGGIYKVSSAEVSSASCILDGGGGFYFADDVLEPAELSALNDLPDISEDDFRQILGGVL